jgi:hypothetical protein
LWRVVSYRETWSGIRGLLDFFLRGGWGWILVWGLCFEECFLAGEFEVFEGRFDEEAVKTVGMEVGLAKVGGVWPRGIS